MSQRDVPAPAGEVRPSIVLPPDLRPCDGRFGAGPSKIRADALASLDGVSHTYLGTSHRRDPVRSVIGRIREGLASLFALPDGYEVLLGNGGTTAFWDAAVACLIGRRSRHLVFGEFSARFVEVVRRAPWLACPDVVSSPHGTHPPVRASQDCDALALTHCETSSGVAMPVVRPLGMSDDALVLVDATSAAGGLWVDPTAFDAYYFAPQKCFGGEGGIWIAALSPRAVSRLACVAGNGDRWIPWSLDLRTALENSRKDQTVNTPALMTLWLLADSIDWMRAQGGLEFACARCDESAAIVYQWAENHELARPFVARPEQRSHSVAVLEFEGVDALAIATALRQNGIVDVEGYGSAKHRQLRIALYPQIEPDDVAVLTRAIDHVLERLLGRPPTGRGEPQAAEVSSPGASDTREEASMLTWLRSLWDEEAWAAGEPPRLR